MKSFAAFAVALAAGMIAHASESSAFVQTMTCNADGGPFACGPGETPKPVHWEQNCVVFYVNQDGSADQPGDGGVIHPEVLNAVRQSFEAWSDVPQSDLLLQYGGLTDETNAEFEEDRGEEGNANIVIWRDTDWPYVSRTAFAITSVTFDPTTGIIADADIELNGEFHQFTTADDGSRVDVRNTLTHEAGHFLGLDHTSIPDATMFGSAPEGELQKRSLHADDIQGLISLYPATGEPVECGPFDDFFAQPGNEVADEGCCKGSSSVQRSTPASLALIALLSVVVIRRRRRR